MNFACNTKTAYSRFVYSYFFNQFFYMFSIANIIDILLGVNKYIYILICIIFFVSSIGFLIKNASFSAFFKEYELIDGKIDEKKNFILQTYISLSPFISLFACFSTFILDSSMNGSAIKAINMIIHVFSSKWSFG